MATADDVRRIALELEGTTSAPHVDRVAFKVQRIYATLSGDEQTLNLKLTPDEQEFKMLMAPTSFSALPNKWGEQGWTTVALDAIGGDELAAAMRMAWEHGRAKGPRKR